LGCFIPAKRSIGDINELGNRNFGLKRQRGVTKSTDSKAGKNLPLNPKNTITITDKHATINCDRIAWNSYESAAYL
jgi:hypothetical protein